MHPNVFLQTLWRMQVKPQVFVAMSFAPDYQARYDSVIAPAIRRITHRGTRLSPFRVDISKSGDSILTDIMDGIAHSQMILADLSTIGRDSKSGQPYRNGNVMYEVGLALACRLPADVLLVRDDKDAFLFDVSDVPHMDLDFTDPVAAQDRLCAELVARLREQTFAADARIQMAIARLGNEETRVLGDLAELPEGQVRGWNFGGTVLSTCEAAITRLLDKGLIRLVGKFDEGFTGYVLTPLGRVAAGIAKGGLPTFARSPLSEEPASEGETTGNPSLPGSDERQ